MLRLSHAAMIVLSMTHILEFVVRQRPRHFVIRLSITRKKIVARGSTRIRSLTSSGQQRPVLSKVKKKWNPSQKKKGAEKSVFIHVSHYSFFLLLLLF
jgi:hypothetical protein